MHSVTDSRSWGNHWDSISPANVNGHKTKQVTGFSKYWKTKNIYDLAGNTWEWTAEKYSSYYIGRGGDYNGSGSTYPVSHRNSNQNLSYTNGNVSFRILLYVM